MGRPCDCRNAIVNASPAETENYRASASDQEKGMSKDESQNLKEELMILCQPLQTMEGGTSS